MSGNNIQSSGALGLWGGVTGYGGGGDLVSTRSMIDYLRLGSPNRTPAAQYPDGFLGTTTGSRQQDKLLQSISKLNNRPYTRGVHKGSRIDPGDYVWPDNWNPQRGIKYEARGLKTPPFAVSPEIRLVGGMHNAPYDGPDPVPIVPDPHRLKQLGPLAPSWT